MLTTYQLDALYTALGAIGDKALLTKKATLPIKVNLRDKMAGLLGTSQRRLVPFLDTVTDAIANKIFLKELATPATDITPWKRVNRLTSLERKLYRAVVRDGTAYILVTWDNKGYPRYTLREMYDGNAGAYVFHNDKGEVTHGVNAWSDDGALYLDVYFPNRIEKYQKSEGKWTPVPTEIDGASVWPVEWVAGDGTPLGVALIPFTIGDSDIEAALQVQTDLNEALIDITAISRNQGFPQRYIKGEKNAEYLTNEYGSPLVGITGVPIRRNLALEPGSVLTLMNPDAELGQLDAANPNTGIVDMHLELISQLTTVPRFYFRGDFPSGVALLQAEARLNSKVESHQDEITPSWEETVRLSLRLSNTFNGTSLDISAPVMIDWYTPEVMTADLQMEMEKHRVTTTSVAYTAGLISLEEAVAALHADWTQDRIEAEIARLKVNDALNNL